MLRKVAGDPVLIVAAAYFIAQGPDIFPRIGDRHGTACGFKHRHIVQGMT